MNLTTATPAEIDAKIAKIAPKAQAAEARAAFYLSPRGRTSFRAAEHAVEARATANRLDAKLAPLHAEYTRRGRWNRAFLVPGGHVHSSMNCSTCNREDERTLFSWIPEQSGKTEAEIIKFAGVRACTVCSPNAPVTPQMRKAAKAAKVAARKAKRKAAKAAKLAAQMLASQAAAMKVDDLLIHYGSYQAMSDDFYREGGEFSKGGRFAKGYDTAYYTIADMDRRRRPVRRAA